MVDMNHRNVGTTNIMSQRTKLSIPDVNRSWPAIMFISAIPKIAFKYCIAAVVRLHRPTLIREYGLGALPIILHLKWSGHSALGKPVVIAILSPSPVFLPDGE